MELLDNGFVKVGACTILKPSKVSAVKLYHGSIIIVVDGQAISIDFGNNIHGRDEEFTKLTNLLTTKQKKNN